MMMRLAIGYDRRVASSNLETATRFMSHTLNNSIAPRAALSPELEDRLDEVRLQEKKKQSLRQQVMRERRVLLPALGIALLALPNFRMAEVTGHSMEPQYDTGDRLVVLKSYRLFTPLKVGDIVVIKRKYGKDAGEQLVKRVVFIQNDDGTAKWPATVRTMRGDIPMEPFFPDEVEGSRVVPPNGIMVMGDNIMNSSDSREFGALRDEEIMGKVLNH